MALPVVRTLTECADFQNTVAPYIHQLRPFPQVFWESIANPAALKQLYVDTNPLVTSTAFALAIAPIFLLVSEINRNYSQVDRFWSILPTVFNFHYAVYARAAGIDTKRVDAVLAVSMLWSVRLTYNYYRKGGYNVGTEDYRWATVKATIGAPLFFVMNVVFIAFMQCILLLAVTTPTYVLLLTGRLASNSSSSQGWTILDPVPYVFMLALIGISFIADQQQWDFHKAKAEYQKTAKVPTDYSRAELDRGFLSSGLWAYSRHPNFTAEQGVWVALYIWSCVASQTLYNWTGVGAFSYLCLFQGSTWLTELLSSQKYPDYKVYQRHVGKFLPIPGMSAKFPTSASKPVNGSEKGTSDATKARARYDLR
ncbi:hypothetical protein B0A52_02313 [Exophiala mesophila]|uniref:Steroid 5-alpha reductase C-terminal domain-containing protein n=1 Tax=Exophiala mesophila TaxID=212818 RepID=A0A438NBM9_EXOME|nr:hypothetical protein B0A52_02313 [Exophiala mesophila]